jgi:aryl-alcohol dehydrogenase-like predicted oxidoreductase
VRYIGFSDTPAWKCAQAQMMAEFRGWAPVIALQIEYSLLERTVEGDLMPMAEEMGMGVTPWSPLKGGVLSGKYTRNSAPATEGRGTSPWVTNQLNERTYGVIDTLIGVAKEVGATPAQVALAWVQSRPGVVSSIIGARTLQQLDDNLAALDVKLSAAQVKTLDDATAPVLSFPHVFLDFVADNVQGGTTVNGRPSKVWGLAPQSDAERH